MPGPRSNLLNFAKSRRSNRVLPVTKLRSLRCAMLPAKSRKRSAFESKAAQLHAAAPDIAEIVEALLDDLLIDIA